VNSYHWQQVREQAAEIIGYPSASIEDAIIDTFRTNPAAVVQAIERILAKVDSKKLSAGAGWLIIRREVEQITRPAPDVVATDMHERERALERARRWMQHAGLHFPNAAEVLDELFERGMLREFNDDPARQEILRCYRRLRPLGEQLDAEELERAERLRAQRAGRTRHAEAA
jgi:hypothetical protein